VPLTSERLRVLHLITRLELGGAQRNTLATCHGLDPSRFDAHLAYGPGGMLDNQVRCAFSPLPALQRAVCPVRDLRALRQIRALLASWRPHVLHTHSSKAGILGRWAARSFPQIRVVHTVHGFAFPLDGSGGGGGRLYRFLEGLAARWTDRLVFVSREDMAFAAARGWCPRGRVLIRSGFPLGDYRPCPERRQEQRRRFGIPEDALVCGVVAPFKPQKGLMHMVKVVRHLKKMAGRPFRVLVAGDGALRSELERWLCEAGVRDCVLLPGFLDDLNEVMDLFDVGLSTSLWEGLPQSVVQMRQKGIPLVVSDIPGHRELIRPGENGWLCRVEDEAGMARRLSQLLESDALRLKMGKATEHYADWDLPEMIRRQEDLYRDLCSRDRGNGARGPGHEV